MMYQFGRGVKVNTTKAIKYYKSAYKRRCYKGLSNLGRLYSNQEPPNYDKALKCYRIGADHNDLRCMYNLGASYKDGVYVERNYQKALTYFERVATQDPNIGEVQIHIAEILSIKDIIATSLKIYISMDTHEGSSYLFFGNFLMFLTKRYNISDWDDPLFRLWITDALSTHFKTINPEFDTNQIGEWFTALFA